jgi:hypothetical protein
MPSLLGSKPNQVSTNGDLGTLAFQDSNAVNIVGGTAAIDNLTADSINLKVDSDLTNISPSLLLDFANTEALDPRITFTRASTASFYDGRTTAKAEENLLIRSEEFDNAAWAAKTNITVTANSNTSPNGATTAELIVPTVTSGLHRFRGDASITTGVVYTVSIFAKASGYNFLYVNGLGTAAQVCFDLTTGTVAATANGTGSIQSVGNDWYRCVVTATANVTSANAVLLQINSTGVATDSTFAGDGTSGILFWGAQLEQRSAVSAYTPTTTAPITNYIPALRTAQAGQARFDHAPLTGESLGLLIEEQRVNLLTYSDDFSNAAWTKTRSSITANTIVAPDGTLTGDKLVEDTTASNTHQISRGASQLASITYTYSIYAKAGERTSFTVSRTNAPIVSFTHTYDLSAGTASGGGSMTFVGNGWYRCVGQYSATTDHGEGIVIRLISGSTSYTGDGYSGIYIWGAQLEAGAFATSYIPTVASQVTRSTDAASMTGLNFSSWYRADEGTVYVEANLFSTTSSPGLLSLTDGSTNNAITIFGGTGIAANVRVNAANTFTSSSGSTLTASSTSNKTAIGYKLNNVASSFNAVTPTTSVSAIIPTTLSTLNIGFYTSRINSTIKKISFYPARLPNAELQEMTS